MDYVSGLSGVEGGEALNYAVAGAQALTDRTIAELLPPSVIRPDATAEDLAFRVDIDGQVARFLEDEAGNDLSSTAASLFIGFNDFNDFVPTSPETAFDEVLAFGAAIATETAEAAAALAGAGVGTIILNTLGDPSIFPSIHSMNVPSTTRMAIIRKIVPMAPKPVPLFRLCMNSAPPIRL